MKYYTTKQKPLSENNHRSVSQISRVQSNLCPTLRSIATNGIGYGIGFGALEESAIIPFDKRDFTTLHKQHSMLKEWYEQNQDALKKVQAGDFSDFKTQDSVEPIDPPAPSGDSKS